jgi:hypothetical protein
MVVGAAVPKHIHVGITADFKKVFGSSDLVLLETDSDFLALMKHCEELKVTTPAMTSIVCKYLLKYCGGHVYPVLAFIEHFFTIPEASRYLVSEPCFLTYFHGPKFKTSKIQRKVADICFHELSMKESADALNRVLSNQPKATDLLELNRLGWWNERPCGPISVLLLNEALHLVTKRSMSTSCAPYVKSRPVVDPRRGFCTWNRAALTVLSVPNPVLPFARKSLCLLLKLCK